MNKINSLILTGYIGLFAAIFVGLGEFLLHFDALGRFEGHYTFMLGIDSSRTTWGHFIGVLSAPLYIVGYWHLMKMLEPASEKMAKIAFAIMSYGINELPRCKQRGIIECFSIPLKVKFEVT